MKIKRFFAKEMRQGIRQVREALGADAVILSNTRVNGGVEIVAAVDYDESLLQAERVGQDVLSTSASAKAGVTSPDSESFSQSLLSADTVSISTASSTTSLPELKFSSMQDEKKIAGEIPRDSIDQPSQTAFPSTPASTKQTESTEKPAPMVLKILNGHKTPQSWN